MRWAWAPEANLYDICILEDGISSAMLGYDWAIEQFKKDGTPQILSNSWGIYDASKAPNYATNPNHPFSRKVAEAIDLGITVLVSAGNCGESCPSSRCEDYTGPGKDIWGANGHPDVITVGAMNQNLEWIGYSSSGPAALCDEKPDVCGISHFKGYFDPDTGTSAACPIVAGLVALLLQMSPHHKPATIQAVLQETALQIDGKTGWDSRTGYGLVQAEKAAEILKPKMAGTIPLRHDAIINSISHFKSKYYGFSNSRRSNKSLCKKRRMLFFAQPHRPG